MNHNSIIGKISKAEKDTYIIFFDYGCYYSESALKLLREKGKKYKGYEISKISGGLSKLINKLSKNKETINFNLNHKTKPIIFYNNKFIGGYSELVNMLQ